MPQQRYGGIARPRGYRSDRYPERNKHTTEAGAEDLDRPPFVQHRRHVVVDRLLDTGNLVAKLRLYLSGDGDRVSIFEIWDC
jgi:hypothetical protein